MRERPGSASNPDRQELGVEQLDTFFERLTVPGLADDETWETAAERASRQYELSATNVEARRTLYGHADPPIYLPPDFHRRSSPAHDVRRLGHPTTELLDGIEDEVTDIERRLTAMVYAAGLPKDAKGVDLGCGNNAYLWYNYLRHDHTGEMLGVDVYYPPGREMDFTRLSHNPYPPVSRIPGNAYRLSSILRGRKVKAVFAKGLLYHVNEPEQVLDEVSESLEPGGLLAILTRGSLNMAKLWGYQSLIWTELRKDPRFAELRPSRAFYVDFDIEDHIPALSNRFEIIDYFEQSANPRPKKEIITSEPPRPPTPELDMPEKLRPTHLAFKDKYAWVDYFKGLFSLVNDFKFPKEFDGQEEGVSHAEAVRRTISRYEAVERIIHDIILPEFNSAIENEGVFREDVEQAIFICRKPTK